MYYSTSCLRALALLLSGKTGRAPNAVCIVFNRFAVSLFQYGVDLTNNFPQWLRPLMDGQNTGSCWGLRVPSWRLRVSFENYPRLLVHKTGSDYHTKLWNHSKDWRVLGVCNTTVCFILKKKKKTPANCGTSDYVPALRDLLILWNDLWADSFFVQTKRQTKTNFRCSILLTGIQK